MNFADLKAPFPPDAVHWRVGSTNQNKTRGMALAYIDARDVMDRLDEVCGQDGWQSKFEAVGNRVVCSIGVDISEGGLYAWIWKSDGAGDTDFEPEKGGLSDAFKRAAVQWGIGRYLYDIPAPWVAIEAAGKSFRIKDSEHPKLEALLRGRPLPAGVVIEEARQGIAEEDAAHAGEAPRPTDGMSRARAKEIMAALSGAPSIEESDKLWKRLTDEIMTATPAGQKAIMEVYNVKRAALETSDGA